MKKILTIIFISLILVLGIFNFVEAKTTRVKGYYKPSTSRYVMPYYRTTPNKTKFDNYSTKGNINPFTGKKGSVSPLKTLKFR